jgi:protein-S-isoprenylcysteine O-methyltransferase Ste14
VIIEVSSPFWPITALAISVTSGAFGLSPLVDALNPAGPANIDNQKRNAASIRDAIQNAPLNQRKLWINIRPVTASGIAGRGDNMKPLQADRPNVIAPPPLIYLGFLAIGFVFDHFWPVQFLPDGDWRFYPAAVLIALGGGLIALGLRELKRVGTQVSPHRPTTALATRGVYGYTRNPLYLSLTLIYLGIAAAANALWIFLLAAPLIIVIRLGVIAREERYLETKFGEPYRRYKAHVPRWV